LVTVVVLSAINNDYLEELSTLLVEGVGRVIEENNKKVISDVERDLRLKKRGVL
jgi:hypothetical protein